MTKKQYQRYSPEFKLHALKRASEDGVTDKDICEELGMSRRQLHRLSRPHEWLDQCEGRSTVANSGHERYRPPF